MDRRLTLTLLIAACFAVLGGCQKPQNGNAEGIGGQERPASLLPCKGCDPQRPILWACQSRDEADRDLRMRVYQTGSGVEGYLEEVDDGGIVASQSYPSLSYVEKALTIDGTEEGPRGGTLYTFGAGAVPPLSLLSVSITATDYPTLTLQEYASALAFAHAVEGGLELSDVPAVCWLLAEELQ